MLNASLLRQIELIKGLQVFTAPPIRIQLGSDVPTLSSSTKSVVLSFKAPEHVSQVSQGVAHK